jgi:hypothetical protein
MRSLLWNQFNGSLFQKLCNSLLLFEVSKFAHVFSAEGKDSGIDQYYNGEYHGKQGKWRFQDKFHNSGNKTNDIRELKRDIKKEIEKITEENFLVFITNVNLTPLKYREYINYAVDLLNKDATKCEFLLWHESNVEALVSQNPIIYNWFWEKESILLTPPEEYFRKELDQNNTDLRYQLHNKFIGRQNDIEHIAEFLKDRERTTLALVANGGYGKTRLCLEFLKNKIGKDNEWIPLVLFHTGYSASHFKQILSSKRRLLVLIDNAHEIPDIVSDVKRLIDNNNGKDKLLLTSRNTLFSEILGKLPSRNRNIDRKDLSKLTYEETKSLFLTELPWLMEKDIIRLAEVSKGIPNVILEFIRLIRSGKQPYEISSDDSFTNSVHEILAQAADDIERNTFISKEVTLDFLKLSSIISPVGNNQEDKAFISKVLNLRVDKLELLINELSVLGLLHKYSLAIKPDPYSDTLLTQTIKKNKSFIDHVLDQENASKYFENILKNLAEAEIGEAEKSFFIDNLLYDHVETVKNETDLKKIKNIYEFVNKVFYLKPELAITSVKHFIEIYKDTSHAIHSSFDSWTSKKYVETITEEVDKILTNLFAYSEYVKDNLEIIHSLLEEYISLTNRFKLIGNCYGYREFDFNAFGYNPRQCCEKQMFLKNICCHYLKDDSSLFSLNIALSGISTLLVLDFHIEGYFEEATMKFHFGTAQVPMCEHIKEFRKEIVAALIKFYQKHNNNDELKETGLKELLRYFFYCSTGYEKKHKQKIGEDEIKMVLEFFKVLVKTATIQEKNKILSRINIKDRKEIKLEYVNDIEIIRKEASKLNSLQEELEMLIISEDYFDVIKNFEEKIGSLITKYGPFAAFQNDLIPISQKLFSQANKPTNFQLILNFVAKNYHEEARFLYSEIQTNHEDLISEYTTIVRGNYKDRDYYYGVIKYLWQRRDKFCYQVFWLLTYGRDRNVEYYEESDLEYFEYAINNKLEQAYSFITSELINYAYKNRTRTFQLLDQFINLIPINVEDNFIMYTFSENKKVTTDFKDELKSLLFKNIEHFSVDDNYADHVLQFLDDEHGFYTVFEFVKIKVASALQGDEYKYLTLRDHNYSNKKLSEIEKIERYLIVLQWFVESYTGSEKDFEYVVEFFAPKEVFSEELKNAVLQLGEQYLNEPKKLDNLCTAISMLPPSSEHQIITLCRIVEVYIITNPNDRNIQRFFSHHYYRSSGGVKTGRGVPYPEDVAKKKFLEKILEQNEFVPQVKKVLQDCIINVNRAIEEEISRDNEQLDW